MEENIPFSCAPFEAKWQLVKFECSKKIDGIICVDSDFVILGAENLYIDMRFNKRSPTCHHYKRDPDLYGSRFNLHMYKNILPEASNFMGNDYIEAIPGTGPVTALNN